MDVPQVASWLLREQARNRSMFFSFLWMSCLTKMFGNAAAVLFPACRRSEHHDGPC